MFNYECNSYIVHKYKIITSNNISMSLKSENYVENSGILRNDWTQLRSITFMYHAFHRHLRFSTIKLGHFLKIYPFQMS